MPLGPRACASVAGVLESTTATVRCGRRGRERAGRGEDSAGEVGGTGSESIYVSATARVSAMSLISDVGKCTVTTGKLRTAV